MPGVGFEPTIRFRQTGLSRSCIPIPCTRANYTYAHINSIAASTVSDLLGGSVVRTPPPYWRSFQTTLGICLETRWVAFAATRGLGATYALPGSSFLSDYKVGPTKVA